MLNVANHPPKTSDKSGSVFELVRFALIAIAIVVPIRLFVAQPFIVSGASMVPTFSHGEYLIVDEFSYRFEKPERGDVIIFSYPRDPSKYFIKRIIGLPGETLEIKGKNIIIKNKIHPKGFSLEEPYVESQTFGERIYFLNEDEYFVLGDNRPASSDSRSWGPLPEKYIKGKPFLRLLPIQRITVFPGDYSFSQ
ncbi:MAG: signal peptidase I [Candidatus Taylorbacteria bacterium]|nr:signal peptidase I [Candidatus Taylorbacteria bacterium]